MDPVGAISLALGASWASGLNLYAAILTLGLMQNFGSIQLPANLQIVADPLVLLAAGAMYLIEFFADKIPGVDTGWDAVHTFIRIPAGAVLAAKAIGPVDPALMLAAGLLGGTLAGTSHALKASSRLLINTSPEPFSNWAASLAEDALVFGGVWSSVHHPAVFLVLLAAFVAGVIWLLPKMFRLLRRLLSRIAGFFRGSAAVPSPQLEPAADPHGVSVAPRTGAQDAPRSRRFAGRETGRGYRGGRPS